MCFFFHPAFAQKNAINGRIVDEKNTALSGAAVFLKGTVRGVQSDSEGRYQLTNIPAGSYQLVVSLLGFESISRGTT